MVAELIRAAHDRHVKERIDYTDNQNTLPRRTLDTPIYGPLVTLFEYPHTQKPTPVPVATPTVYQLRIALVDIEPEIWRWVLVRSDATLEDLHDIIQMCFGWEDVPKAVWINRPRGPEDPPVTAAAGRNPALPSP